MDSLTITSTVKEVSDAIESCGFDDIAYSFRG